MGPLQGSLVGCGWALEETGDRSTYVADLSDLHRLPQGFGDTPSPGEIEVVWIGEGADDALALGERLDRLARRLWGEMRRAELTVCLEARRPDAAVRNVVAARFGRVVCGVSARDLLDLGPLAGLDQASGAVSENPKSSS
jgi:hypothetical protein